MRRPTHDAVAAHQYYQIFTDCGSIGVEFRLFRTAVEGGSVQDHFYFRTRKRTISIWPLSSHSYSSVSETLKATIPSCL